MNKSNELQIGKAGEYLVCADLIIKGFVAYPSEQGLPYDVVLDTGNKLLRIQVKTTSKPLHMKQRANEYPAYLFSIKRAGKTGKTRYTENDIDLFAMVALDTKEIAYVWNKDMPTSINIRCSAFKGRYRDEKAIKQFKEVQLLKEQGLSLRQISEKANVAYSIVSKMLTKGYQPHQTNARYMCDLARDAEWFITMQL